LANSLANANDYANANANVFANSLANANSYANTNANDYANRYDFFTKYTIDIK
jgi:hypothetical protein